MNKKILQLFVAIITIFIAVWFWGYMTSPKSFDEKNSLLQLQGNKPVSDATVTLLSALNNPIARVYVAYGLFGLIYFKSILVAFITMTVFLIPYIKYKLCRTLMVAQMLPAPYRRAGNPAPCQNNPLY